MQQDPQRQRLVLENTKTKQTSDELSKVNSKDRVYGHVKMRTILSNVCH